MKIRNGFVSNSSSSSFVVNRVKDPFSTTPTVQVDQSKAKLLEDFGFTTNKIENEDNEIQSLYRNWEYHVICNQDEVIQFLVENQIPFEASVHYGHYTYFYQPEKDKLYIFTNYGEIASTYQSSFEKYTEMWKKEKPFEVHTASEWVKKYCY